jgi:cytochrome c biogenesis protein CcmG, thiol:disulfide interchange protein DsbE
MTKILQILFLTLSFFFIHNLHAVEIGEAAPNWQLKNGYNEDINFHQDTDNKVSILIYWATWCPYCASLMPHLQEVADEYNGNDDVVFYAMNINETGDPKRHLQEKHYSFSLILDADATMDDYGVRGTPNVFVIDKQNKVIFRRVPDTPDVDVRDGMRDAIAAALK